MAKRTDYSDTLKWNVKDLYPTIEDFNQAYTKLEQDLAKYPEFEGHILDSAKSLLKFLTFDTEYSRNLEQAYIYAHLQNDQDTTDTFYQALYGKMGKLYEKYRAASAYVTPEILKKDFKVVEEYLKEEPKLVEFERALKETYRFKKYTLSAKEEYILSSLTSAFKTPDEVYSFLTDADLTFGTISDEQNKKVELTEKTYRQFIESKDRKVRKRAFTKLLGTYSNFKNTYATLLMAEVKNNNKVAALRGFNNALEASLYADSIPPVIYDNLIKAVKRNVAPLSKFWKLKAQALGVSKLHLYDTYAPITKETTKKYTEKEAEELLYKALLPLSETYINDLKKAFKEKWIDFCPNDGKRNGAYCTACYNVHPYVLLSYDGSLNNVSTLAHELGHAMHYYYAIKNQKYQDYGYSIFVAEVASQVNQILLSKYLIQNTQDKATKKYLIDDLIQDFKSTIYRQTMFGEFEKIIHEEDDQGHILTHEELSNIYYQLNLDYFGQNIVVDDIIRFEWERIPHFYMNFYVYQYATAYAAAIKIAMDILNHKDQATEKYLKFLSLGCTIDPIASLKVAGVDMNDSKTLDEAFVYFNDLVDELTKLYE